MNAQASALHCRLDAAITDAGDLDAFRRQALQCLRPKAVVKESHCRAIQALAFNLEHPACRHLFATVARGQVTVYDDEHLGDHISVVLQYAPPPAASGQPVDVYACAWLPPQHAAPDDAWLAVGASDRAVHVISAAEAAVIRLLPGHGADPVDLSTCATAPRLLLALCRDGGARLWDVEREECLAVVAKSDAFSAALSPCGSFFLTGSRAGRAAVWRPAPGGAGQAADVAGGDQRRPAAQPLEAKPPCVQEQQLQQQQEQGKQEQQAAEGPAGGAQQEERLLAAWRGGGSTGGSTGSGGGDGGGGGGAQLLREAVDLPGLGGSAVEALYFLDGGRLLARCVDGRVLVFVWPARALAAHWRVPGCGGQGGASHHSRCGLTRTRDGRAVAAGNPSGHAFVFDARSGAQLAVLAPLRAAGGAARGVGLSEDCRHVLVAAGDGFVVRHEMRCV
ncbi:MAG: WD40-repeat-containing domain protein [Monoraphidium minutum]|nr:MAG: WD40-repeat-containing domain protein [Monoraphidium minutum]